MKTKLPDETIGGVSILTGAEIQELVRLHREYLKGQTVLREYLESRELDVATAYAEARTAARSA